MNCPECGFDWSYHYKVGCATCTDKQWAREAEEDRVSECEACEQLKLPVEARWAMRIDHTCGKGTP